MNLDDLQSEINENYLYGMNKPKIKSVKKVTISLKLTFIKKNQKNYVYFNCLQIR